MDQITKIISEEINQPAQYVQNVIDLYKEGNTIPFIARYRKEAHGAMDDTSLRKLEERYKYLTNLAERRDEIIKSIENQGKMTAELQSALQAALTMSDLEDIYRPYKQKRKTRASVAREKGLEPLAMQLLAQDDPHISPEKAAVKFLKNFDLKDIDKDQALSGASDIIAEMISDSAEYRKGLRKLYFERGSISSRSASEEETVYDTYKDYSQSLSKLQGHQILAMNRGEKENKLKVSVEIEDDTALTYLHKRVIKKQTKGTELEDFLKSVIADSYSRLLAPSMENDIRSQLTEDASEGAIHNFALNLKPLLMQPPVKGKVTMGLDPGYRMGCKVAVVDPTGKVLDTAVVYPTHGDRQKQEAIDKLSRLIKKYHVEHIAIGNGTASRETEIMTAELIHICPGTSYMVVSEAGASVYSASELAAKEFPQYDVNLRSAISIARRLQDPLAELVKIDPKSIGVGQYQHDMPQKRLDESLKAVVEDCVNAVGVDINTASASLLQQVSGLNAVCAQNIVTYREANGIYTSRSQIKKVPRLGPKAFEQCAGFLRIPESRNFLDNTAVHPESYDAVRKLLNLFGLSESDIKNGKTDELVIRLRAYGMEKAAAYCEIGLPTLKDIIQELQKPGRDPRESLPAPIFRTDLLEMKDLKPGMVLTGTVRNVIDFGAFVDIGVHQDGLVHISEIADRYIKHPSEVLSVGEDVKVVVLDVDEKKKRIALSIKQAAH